jgi:molybdopterin synthase sulfur carrier subunit
VTPSISRRPVSHDVAGVALDDAVVDDVGVERGQVERGASVEEPYTAVTLADALDAARERHALRPEFARVLLRCSFLVDGAPVGTRDHKTVQLAEGGTVEVLPPFAGG